MWYQHVVASPCMQMKNAHRAPKCAQNSTAGWCPRGRTHQHTFGTSCLQLCLPDVRPTH